MPGMDTHSARAASFDVVVEEYEQGRAGYAPAAIDRLVEIFGIRPDTHLLDLAAGSGKLTRPLVPTGATITAVEPLPQMRARLIATAPSVTAIDGRAEAIPIADSSQDVVVVGSAFHWFDAQPALREIARVLVAGGGVALLGNPESREQGPWHDGVEAVIDAGRPGGSVSRSSEWPQIFAESGLFGELTQETFDWEIRNTVDQYAARVGSMSAAAILPAEQRAKLLADVRAHIRQNLAASGETTFAVRYRTRIAWSRLRAA